jgi:hypothetical protein
MVNAGTSQMSGKATMIYTKKEVVPIGDTGDYKHYGPFE